MTTLNIQTYGMETRWFKGQICESIFLINQEKLKELLSEKINNLYLTKYI